MIHPARTFPAWPSLAAPLLLLAAFQASAAPPSATQPRPHPAPPSGKAVKPAAAAPSAARPELNRQIQRLLETEPAGNTQDGAAADSAEAELPGLYRGRSYQPFWIAGGKPTARAAALRSVLAAAADEGLRPEDYRAEDIGRLWQKPDPASLARLELRLTRTFIRYALDQQQGRNAARRLEAPIPAATGAGGLPTALRKALETPDPGGFLKRLAPRHPHYSALKQALRDYRAIAQAGGWPSIPAGPTLQTGMTDPRIPLLRQRLALTDSAAATSPAAPNAFDPALASAVRRFQQRHSLPDDGIVGAETLAAMNLPVEQRIRQLVLNLERWRWLAVDPAGRHLWVNIPGFALMGLKDGHQELSMPVVVGKIDQPTPAFEERMEYLEFNPGWRVPLEIAVNEYLPELRKDPLSLAKKHIRLFRSADQDAPQVDPRGIDWSQATPASLERYVLRQDPGPWNALGTVKFMFPNKYNVYLHDTSEPRFFAKRRRAYSHGCVRVSRPYELAAWVLAQEPEPWSLERVQATVATGQQVNVPLAKPLPVHLVYRTAWIGEDGSLDFPPDLYGRDGPLAKALSGGQGGETENPIAQLPR
jgi:murein L,D-transpeptidase YcbB/YkuD